MTTATEQKPARLLTTGAVQIMWATDGVISARVRGDSGGIYDIRSTRLAGWSCSCPAFRRCTHIEAVSQVTTRSVSKHQLQTERKSQ